MEVPLFKSNIISEYKNNWCVCFISIIPLFMLIGFLISTKFDLRAIIIMGPVCFSLFALLFWLGIQFLRSHLIIYQNGIKISRPYKSIISKFIPWNSIKDVKIYERGVIGASYDWKSYKELYIFLENQTRSLKISEIWVENLQFAYDLITEFIDPLEIPEFCNWHSESKATHQCRSCGEYLCEHCIEQKKFTGAIFCECSLCLYNLGLNRIKKSYILSLIGPLIFIGFFMVDLFFGLDNFLRNIFYISSFVISIIFNVIITPYGYGLFIANRKRKIILSKLGLKFNEKSLNSLLYLTILVNLVNPIILMALIGLIFTDIFKFAISIFSIIYINLTAFFSLMSYYFERPRKIEEFGKYYDVGMKPLQILIKIVSILFIIYVIALVISIII